MMILFETFDLFDQLGLLLRRQGAVEFSNPQHRKVDHFIHLDSMLGNDNLHTLLIDFFTAKLGDDLIIVLGSINSALI